MSHHYIQKTKVKCGLVSGGPEGGRGDYSCLESKRAGPYHAKAGQVACKGTWVKEILIKLV